MPTATGRPTAAPADRAEVGPAGRLQAVGAAAILGMLAAVLWSFELVDETIGQTVADTVLGYDASGAPLAGPAAGAIFAFVTGLAGTFTACNIAAFSAVAPMATQTGSDSRRLGRILRPLGWMAAGMVAVSATYGAVGVALGSRLPQLSTAQTGAGMPVRLVQSSVVFGLIGLVFVYLGLAAVGILPDPLARLKDKFAPAGLVVVGMLIGGFLIGRPFGLFFRMFQHAADQHNPAYGAVVFVLQSAGNIVVMSLLFVGLVYARQGALVRWLGRTPGRVARTTGGAFVLAGTFTFVYWAIRVPALFGYGWFPRMPWS